MQKTMLATILIAATALLPVAAQTAPPVEADFMLGGIQINEPDQTAWAQTLAANGFNTMHITLYARQGIWNSDDLDVKPVDDGTVEKIRAAHAAGLRVALILRIDLDHAHPENRFLWHGLILPSPDHLDTWFNRYAAFVRQWADVCEREGVELLGLGSEMNAITATRPTDTLPGLEDFYLDAPQQSRRRAEVIAAADRVPAELIRAPGDASAVDNLRVFTTDRDQALYDWAEAVTFGHGEFTQAQRLEKINQRRAALLSRWQALIAEVRSRYSGQLTYAANFDSYMDVGFWPSLDVMGINAYFPLRDPAEPADDAMLAAAWDGVLTEIEADQAAMGVAGMPVVFTELGYTRRAGTTTAPWAYQGFDLVGESKTLMVWETRPMDPNERVRAMSALHRVNQQHDGLLAGLLYWKLTSKDYHAEGEAFSLLLQDDPEHPEADPLQAALLKFVESTDSTPRDQETDAP
ncbi:MAG: hypothetical protein AAF086_04315 [Planctomycetota bacterium]